MTLAFWLELVKRQQATGWISLLCTAIVLTGFWLIWDGSSVERSRAMDYGNSITETLAVQGQESMLAPDPVRLFVLTNRLASLRDVQGAGFYTVTGVPIVESGDMSSAIDDHQEFTRSVSVGQTTSGVVRVRLTAEAFGLAGRVPQFVATIALLLITPILTMLLHELLLMRRRQAAMLEIEEEEEEAPLEPRWLVVGNFYNQLTFPGEMRREISERVMLKAVRVANLYQGHARPGVSASLLLEFASSDDAGFNAVCAAWLLNEVLAEADPDVQFRFALHRVMASPNRDVRAEIIADASLLAAFAPDNSLIASHDFMTSLAQPERCVAQPLDNPMLADIASITGTSYCISELAESQSVLLNQQVGVLLGYSTAIASTR